jgi:hypothetical protein
LARLDDGIEVDEGPAQFSGKKFADRGFATAHEPEEINLFATLPAHSFEVGGAKKLRSREVEKLRSPQTEVDSSPLPITDSLNSHSKL